MKKIGSLEAACNMVKDSSDFDFATPTYSSEVLDGGEGGDLQELDAKFAEQLHIEEAIWSSVEEISASTSTPENTRASTSKPKHEPVKKAGKSLLEDCELCCCGKERQQMFTIPGCSDSFCTDCISWYVKTRLEQNKAKITCPGLNCLSILEPEACMPQLRKEVIDLWGHLLCEELLLAEGGILYCPFKDCSALLLQEEVISETECPICHRFFCAQCLVPWHRGSCEEYQKLNKDELRREDLMLRNLARVNKWARCPKCKRFVERTEGCPHMICRCKFEFCYGCEEPWTYEHSGCQRK